MKLLIEVSGGLVSNIIATDEVSIYLIDHDNIKEKGDIADAKQAFQPDRICNEKEFLEEINEVLSAYESCQYCGEPAKYTDYGFIVCEECYNNNMEGCRDYISNKVKADLE